MSRWSRSIQLVKASWSVIRSAPHLVALPFISFVATAIIVGSFLYPVAMVSDFNANKYSPSFFGWVLLFCMYVVLSYVTVFFNTALICAAQEHFDGGQPTLSSALAGAGQRAWRILPWAIVSATVSMVIRQIQNRAGFAGSLVAGLAGVAWALVTFLVLPIIVIEGLGVGAAIKRSASLFKKVWGEQVVAGAGIGLVGLVAILCGLPVLLLAVTGSLPLIALGVGLFVVWFLLVITVTNAMSGVFQTALYRYAATGEVPADFAAADLPGAFQPRKSRHRR